MARMRMTTDLPPLPEAFPSFRGFAPGESRQQTITQLIRECARSLQRREARPFYPMRQIAAFFDAPLRTVAISYETLDSEGLLARIRGSKTVLAGKRITARKPVNAVVGLPISLQAMIASPFECRLQMELEERLRARGHVADSIFFRPNEDYEPAFAERLVRHDLDFVVWHSPHPLAAHVLLSLRERGVRLVLLQPAESPLRVSARSHVLSWQNAYREMAAAWAADGVRRAVFAEPEHLLARRALRQLAPLLAEHAIKTHTVEADPSALSPLLTPASGPKDGKSVLGFMDFASADALCNGYPDFIDEISRHARVAFCRGAVRVPRLVTRRTRVDVVDLDAAALAEGVVEDLRDEQNQQEGVRATFHAEFLPQVVMGAGPSFP